jgi:hypothetical protein
MSDEEIIGYWFAADDFLPHGDGRAVVIGETLEVEPPIIPCERGLHASVDPFDALQYAPGNILYKVKLSGEIVAHGNDKHAASKHAASKRTAIARRDATQTLWTFARKMALSVIHLWDAPPVVREYLETGDETKRDAARDAARAAAGDAARDAARDAAWAAAWAAAWSAAGDAARDAARDAAWAAAWAAAWSAAGDAARAAARDAAWDAARKIFNELIEQLFDGDS